MAGSQLKRLKASLKEQGIIGPQQSKKQKRKNAQDQKARNDKRLQRSVVLENIREQFNPFQFKINARGPKFDVTTNRPQADKGIAGRPGVSKAMGEEKRRQTLLVEMQRRNKVGGILDRRFGEDDPNMTPEEKMLERFAQEKQRLYKKSSIFDLEEDDEPAEGLTHMGRPLDLDREVPVMEDFDEADLPSDDESDSSEAERKRRKRMRLAEAGEEDGGDEPDRKKSKKEIMDEVIAKSKLHKHERQAVKEQDEDLRAALDKELQNIAPLLLGHEKPRVGVEKPALPLIPGIDKTAMEKEYDVRLRQMIQDRRAQPATRTKTEEEKAEEEAKRLKELEEKRLKRMRGEQVSDDESSDESSSGDDEKDGKKAKRKGKSSTQVVEEEDDDEFGLGGGIKMRPTATELGFDDEDDFLIDEDLVASGSDLDVGSDFEDEESDSGAESGSESEDDDEFTKGLLTETESKNLLFQEPVKSQGNDESGVPYTFPCPQTHAELLEALKQVPVAKLPTAVQRIRALYHPKLDSRNKEKLGRFSQTLVRHIAYLADSPEPPLPAIESLIRHVHSLAKSFPIEVAQAYRAHVQDLAKARPLAPNVGDLVIFTAIGTIFPTSDHFHQVVTPAMLSIARYLGQKIPESLADYATGTYLSTVALEYQKLSKRYVPELMNFCLNTLCALAPERSVERLGFFPVHEPPSGTRCRDCQSAAPRKLTLRDCRDARPSSSEAATTESLKLSILSAATGVLRAAADTWTGKASFTETFEPALRVLQHLSSPACRAHLPPATLATLQQAASLPLGGAAPGPAGAPPAGAAPPPTTGNPHTGAQVRDGVRPDKAVRPGSGPGGGGAAAQGAQARAQGGAARAAARRGVPRARGPAAEEGARRGVREEVQEAGGGDPGRGGEGGEGVREGEGVEEAKEVRRSGSWVGRRALVVTQLMAVFLDWLRVCCHRSQTIQKVLDCTHSHETLMIWRSPQVQGRVELTLALMQMKLFDAYHTS
ncbi:hypothetical protein VTK73DRAFT_8147 [Phialemonium thermophilum]|uniref:Uncharacterized protein n=1 Tax=Phialemonium thermophilum TaxID=223376 RepID=A0ABR3WAC4_9PEZI